MAEKYNEQMLREVAAISESWAGLARNLGAGKSASTVQHLKRRIKSFVIDTSHFTHRNSAVEEAKRPYAKDILVTKPEGSPRTPRKQLIRHMMEAGVEYKCALCPILYEWNGGILNLDIDHINGNGIDNRIENLRFLCPNCHSQQPTTNRSRSYNPYSNDPKTIQAVSEHKSEKKALKFNDCPKCEGKKLKTAKICKECVDLKANLSNLATSLKPHQLKEVLKAVKKTSYREAGRKYGCVDTTIRMFFIRNGIDPKTFKKLKY